MFQAIQGKEALVQAAATVLAAKPMHKFHEVLSQSLTVTSFSVKSGAKISLMGDGAHLVKYEDKATPYYRLFIVQNGVTTAYNILSKYKESMADFVEQVPGTSQLKLDIVLANFVNLSTRIKYVTPAGAEWFSLEEWQSLPNSANLTPEQVIEAGSMSPFVIPTKEIQVVADETKDLVVESPTVAQQAVAPTAVANPVPATAAPVAPTAPVNPFAK